MDGYYFTIASKTTVDPNTGIGTVDGRNAVLWYKNFKSGGRNDGDSPDFNVILAPIYGLGGAPPINDPAKLDDDFGNGKIVFPDSSSVSGSIAFNGVGIGESAGFFVKSADGSDPLRYKIFRADGRIFYTDPDGFEYKCMHFAQNPLIIG